jgi:hypothetical protein
VHGSGARHEEGGELDGREVEAGHEGGDKLGGEPVSSIPAEAALSVQVAGYPVHKVGGSSGQTYGTSSDGLAPEPRAAGEWSTEPTTGSSVPGEGAETRTPNLKLHWWATALAASGTS